MNINDLINELEQVREEHGNLEIDVGADYEGRNPQIFFYKKEANSIKI